MADNIFTTLDLVNDVVNNVPNRVTYGLWSTGAGQLTTFYTSSEQSASENNTGKYYFDIRKDASSGSSQTEFSIAYGHVANSGSIAADRDKPYQAVYSQYRNLLLDTKNGKFTLADNTVLNDIYVINFSRANLKEKLDAGNWQINISGSGTSMLKLIDDSGDSTDTKLTSLGEVFNIVSGTIENGALASSNYYGLAYLDYGILILRPQGIVSSASLSGYATGSSNVKMDANVQVLFDGLVRGQSFKARSEELISSAHYFIRVKNKMYNYSSNPTFYSSSDGTLLYDDFAYNPKTYITSIGLYNDNNEMLAVAKLSQPVEKSFDKEALVKIRLDF